MVMVGTEPLTSLTIGISVGTRLGANRQAGGRNSSCRSRVTELLRRKLLSRGKRVRHFGSNIANSQFL